MLKKFFNKKDDDKNKVEETQKPRTKIVIKQRRPSSAPLPNSIANAMSPHSMPNESLTRSYQAEEYVPEVKVEAPATPVPAQPEFDVSFYENRITELKEENKSLYAELHSFEKSSAIEKDEFTSKIAQQKNNYASLEDEFLRRKEELDQLKGDLADVQSNFELVSEELTEIKSTTVAKNELTKVQSLLRENIQIKTDLQTQVDTLKKDQVRYESMVSQLSNHITELKDSFDGSSEEQFEKLMEVKDQEISRNNEYIEDLEKQVKALQTDKSGLVEKISQKDIIIDESQEFEAQLIDSKNEIQDLIDRIELIEKEKSSLEDQASLNESDLSSISDKVTSYDAKIEQKNKEIEAFKIIRKKYLLYEDFE
jgi:chromosome segregation ATPase